MDVDYGQKYLSVLVLNVRNSSNEQLTKGLQVLKFQILNYDIVAARLEIAVVSITPEIKVVVEPTHISKFETQSMLCCESSHYIDVISGLRRAIDIVSARKRYYKSSALLLSAIYYNYYRL